MVNHELQSSEAFNLIIYDIETARAIPLYNDDSLIADIEYCAGWHDHANMGIACICVYDYRCDGYSVFMQDNFGEFRELMEDVGRVAGFNNLSFDNVLCGYNDINIPRNKSYDLLEEIWKSANLGPIYNVKTHSGYGLDAVARANLGETKNGWGGNAPIWFQRGEFGKLITYCLRDVWLIKRLLDKVIHTGQIISPVTGEKLFLSL